MARAALPRWYRDQARAAAKPGKTVLASRFARQCARARELDEIRIERRLTDAEAAEADRITMAIYQRERRQLLRERGIGA